MVNDKNPFEDRLNKDIKSYGNELTGFEEKISKVRKQEGIDKNKVITDKNQKYQDLSSGYKDELGDIKDKAESNIETRRKESDTIVADQQQNAGREAMIQSEGASRAGRLSSNAISKLNSDITARFSDQLANAKKDNLKFQTEMDNKITELGFTVQDKNRIIDSFTKSMDDEAAAPLLASITAQANNKEDFVKLLSDMVTQLRNTTLTESNVRSNKQKKLVETDEGFKEMDSNTKRMFVLDKISSLINIEQKVKDKLIKDVLNSNISYADFLEQTYALKDKNDSVEAQKQTLVGSEFEGKIGDTLGSKLYNNGVGTNVQGESKRPTVRSNNSFLSPEENDTKNKDVKSKVTTTKSKASTKSKVIIVSKSQAKKLNKYLSGLKKSNPAKYKTIKAKIAAASKSGRLKFK